MLMPDHLKFSLIVTNEDFVVRDHQLHGVRAVPGVTFLDLIYRYLAMKGIDTQSLAVRNMLFLEPVVTSAEYDQKIEVSIDRTGGCWKLEARSRKWKNGRPAGAESSHNMKAELHPASPLPARSIDPRRLAERAHTVSDMDSCYQYSRRSGLIHYEGMKLEGRVYLGDGYVLGDASLSAESARHLEQFLMHPAFLDGSLSVPCLMILNKVEVDYEQAKPFIPIYIESFQTLGPFGSSCYVYTEDKRITLSPSQDIMYMDIEIYNEQGSLIAAYTKFSAKRVRSESGIRELQQRAASEVPSLQASAAAPQAVPSSLSGPHSSPAVKVRREAAAVERTIAELAAEILGTAEEQIEREDDFYTLGLDSRHLLQMAEKLEQVFEMELYPTLLFEYNTIRKLSGYFTEQEGAKPLPVGPDLKPADSESGGRKAGEPRETARLESELCDLVGQMLGRDAGAIDRDCEFYGLGLDSRQLLQLVEQLEAAYSLELYPTLLFEYTDIRKLAGYLATATAASARQVMAPAPAESAGKPNGPTPDFYYYPGWVPAPLIRSSAEDKIGAFLVIYTEESEHLAAFLTRIYSPAASVSVKLTAGRTLKTASSTWEADASDPEAFGRIVLESGEFDEVFFLGGLASDGREAGFAEGVAHSQLYGVTSLFRLVQALDQIRWFAPDKRITVLTNQAVQVQPDEQVHPHGAALHGFVKSLSKEQLSGFVLVDTDVRALQAQRSQDEQMELVHRLREEPAQKNGEMIAYRGAQRFVQIIERAKPVMGQAAFKERGVYLIVGGAGGIGLELGRYLSSRYKASLILTGRREATELQRQHIAEIGRLGGQAEYIQADVTDLKAMMRVVLHAEQHYGKLNGAVHSAIVLEDSTVRRMGEESLSRVLSPKVRGSAVLYEVLKDKPMDFMLFFSSSQSFMANFGQSNYAAGCSFKDALSAYWNQNAASPAVTINWGYWGSVGIVAKEEYYRKITASGVLSIEPQEGMQAIEAALSCGSGQLIAVKIEEGLHKQHGIDPEQFVMLYPSALPSVQKELVRQLEDTLRETGPDGGGTEMAMESYQTFQNKLALSYFQQAGYFRQEGETHDLPDLLRKLGILEAYGRMASALMDILERAGFIAVEGLNVRVLIPSAAQWRRLSADPNELEREKHRLVADLPEMAPHIELLWICVQAYPSVLSGLTGYMPVMFPKGSTRLVEKIYQGNAVTDYYNLLVAKAIHAYVARRLEQDPAAVITILEVGAGTGGTSRFVLEALKAYEANIAYLFTDLALDFTPAKDEQFRRRHPNVSFRALDIEEDLERQGVSPGSCDLIFASNALHATRNIVPSLNNAKKALKKNGLLIINESTELNDFVTLTFGLTTGWWLYEDSAVRIKESPLLKQHTWLQLLQFAGFKDGRALGLNDSLYNRQRVIVAESDGCSGARSSRDWKKTISDGISALAQPVYTEQVAAAAEAVSGVELTVRPVPEENAAAEAASIEILAIDEGELDRTFTGRWLDMKKGCRLPASPIDLAKEYVSLAGSKKRKTVHMLVETPLSGKMEVVVSGSGPTILLINGFGLTAPQWLHQLNAWSSEYRVVVIHIPGCGLSVTKRALDLEGLSTAFMDTLEALDLQWPIHVVGLSWGGMAAQALAARYPKKLASLVLVNTFEHYRQGDQLLRDTMQADFDKQGNNGRQLVFDSEFMNGQVREWGETAKRGFTTSAYVPLIKTPALLIAGGADTVIAPEASQALAAQIRAAEYYEICGAGHVPNVTHPEEFNRVVLDFIRKQEVLRDFVTKSLIPAGERIFSLEESRAEEGAPSSATAEWQKREGRSFQRIEVAWESADGSQGLTAFRKVITASAEAEATPPPKSIRKRMVANLFRTLENNNGFKVYEKEAARELAIMQDAELGMLPFCPKVYGTRAAADGGEIWMLLEDLWAADEVQGSSRVMNKVWSEADLKAVISGLADLHSIYYNKPHDKPVAANIGMFDSTMLQTGSDLITELLKLNTRRQPGLIQPEVHNALIEFAEKLPEHVSRMAAAPMTLTHNNCVPWNLCLRGTGSDRQLVAYNWEYAKIQNPQQDLVQFLLFALDPDADSAQLFKYADCYLSRLKEKTGYGGRLDDFLEVLYSNLMEFAAIRLQMSLLKESLSESGAAELAFRRLPAMLRHFETLQV